ncbi:MAG TPA: hypothetical protein VFS21_34260 [Roseiflexaceae bacterium]|nr:hypothetical protein [Roseiflexaceae bacterium]
MGRRLVIVCVLVALAGAFALAPRSWHASAAGLIRRSPGPAAVPSDLSRRPALLRSQQPADRPRPGPTIEAYIRPEFALQMRRLRPAILAAAHRHNQPALSLMSDREFAVLIATLLYNENFGSLEEQVVPLRAFTPFYEDLQARANEMGVANLSVWPANLRPSVALEILQRQVPLPRDGQTLTVPLWVAGSRIAPAAYASQTELYAAISQELTQPELAVEYLAANLERGLYRARVEGVPPTWRALAAWHNQGIVAAHDIHRNPTARDYVRRSAAYLPAARILIERAPCAPLRCRIGPGVPSPE